MAKKKTSDYWIKRAHERAKADIRASDEVIKSINESFYNSLKHIEKEIATLFYRYSEDNELDYDLAIKLLTGDEYKSFRMELEEYIGLIESPEILLELNTLSAKSRISHLEESFFHIQKQIDQVYLHQSEVVQDLMKESIQGNYYKSIFDVGSVVTTDVVVKEFHKLTINEIAKEFERPWSGKNFSERLWKNRTKLKEALEEEIIKMAISGANPEQATETIANRMDVAKRTAATLVHTEQAYFSGLGSLKAYKEMGVDKYIYIATLDLKTSDVCRDLDHEVFDVYQAQTGVNYPPMHPRCRSTTVPYTGDLEGTRTARDKDNNEVKVDKSLSYKEWHEKYVVSDPEYLKEEKKWKNRHSDKKQFEKYKNADVQVPKSFDKYQDLKYNDDKGYWRAKNQYRSFNAIEKKEWSEQFKTKCKDTIKNFAKDHDLDLNEHSVARYYDRIANKDKRTHMSENDFVTLVKSKPNYREPDGNFVVFRNEIAVIKSFDNPNHIISIVPRKNAKKGWIEYD